MLFNSQLFVLGFLPVALAGWYLLAATPTGAPTGRKLWLIAASLVFYAGWNPRYVPLLVGLTLANWALARWFAVSRRTGVPALGVALNLAVLAGFKYADFLGATLAGALGRPWQPWAVVLPLGISFFVFQKISYLVDLRRAGPSQADRHQYSLVDFSLFVAFFPQLIAGPLVRHHEIIPQFAAAPRRPGHWQNLGQGLLLFTIGLLKKVALADTLAGLADATWQHSDRLPAAAAWLGTLAYTLQIYFDFSGYSDMAIGLALMFGLRLPRNFAAPYRAASIRAFWRRWHITLSRFLRDYLYIPLGGDRAGACRQVANVIATMLLGGLWHGANWTFVAWGGLHGAALALNQLWTGRGPALPRPAGWALTSLFVMLCWVLFRSPDFTVAADMFAALAGAHGWAGAGWGGAQGWPGEGGAMIDRTTAITLLGASVIVLVAPTSQAIAFGSWRPRPAYAVPAGALLAWALLLTGGRLQHAFIYFQF